MLSNNLTLTLNIYLLASNAWEEKLGNVEGTKFLATWIFHYEYLNVAISNNYKSRQLAFQFKTLSPSFVLVTPLHNIGNIHVFAGQKPGKFNTFGTSGTKIICARLLAHKNKQLFTRFNLIRSKYEICCASYQSFKKSGPRWGESDILDFAQPSHFMCMISNWFYACLRNKQFHCKDQLCDSPYLYSVTSGTCFSTAF